MNNVNTLNEIDIKPKKSNSFSKLPYVLALCTMLNIANPAGTKADSIANNNLPGIEVVSDSDIIANIERRTGTKLPTQYNQKLKTFITTNRIMKDEGSARFTADFIELQMQNDRGISKQSQLLFIRTHIYNEITGKYLYDGSDGDENRLDEYSNVMERAEKCGKDFRSEYIAYTKEISTEARQQSAEARQQSAEYDRRTAEARQQSAEAKQQSAEAKQQSAEAKQQSAEAVKGIMKQDSLRVKERMVEFYDIYLKNPRNIKQDDLNFMKKSTKEFIADCKKYGINYKAILLKEVGDKKKVDNILKFYGIEYR